MARPSVGRENGTRPKERWEADEQEELKQPQVWTRLELAIERSYVHTTWAPLEASRWIPVRVPISTFDLDPRFD